MKEKQSMKTQSINKEFILLFEHGIPMKINLNIDYISYYF